MSIDGEEVTVGTILVFMLIIAIIYAIFASGRWIEWNNRFDKAHEKFYEGSVR
jgi:hypothetical protein